MKADSGIKLRPLTGADLDTAHAVIDAAIEAARQGGFDGLLVKASPDARGFFAAKGLRRLTAEDEAQKQSRELTADRAQADHSFD